MAICCAIKKHEYPNFSLTILEYCEVAELLIREKHYWDLLNPEYNIAKDHTAPMSGRTHSDDTKIIISDAKKGKIILIMVKLLAMKLNKILSPETVGMLIKEKLLAIKLNK